MGNTLRAAKPFSRALTMPAWYWAGAVAALRIAKSLARALTLVPAVSTLAVAQQSEQSVPDAVPNAMLDESNCLLETSGTSKRYARCATLAVPLDPEMPDGGDFELFVARIPAQVANPQPDPLLLVAGGPGQGTVDFYMQLRGAFAPVRRNRDIILVDQRGTGHSAAGFDCELPEDIDFQIADEAFLKGFVTDCLAGLEHDPRFFTTSAAVRDLDAVRRALGIEQWNIYGGSYGTRVAQHYLRRYPQHVRSVVLDGVVPPALVLGPDMALNAQTALDEIFERCARDEACAARFGDLPGAFGEVMSRTRESPASVSARDPATGEMEETLVTEDYLMGVARLFSYSDSTAALLPLIIDEAANGRFEMLLAQAEMISGNLERSLSFPMHNSVICSEDYPFDVRDGPMAEPSGDSTAGSSRNSVAGSSGSVVAGSSRILVADTTDGSIADSSAYLGTSIMDALNTICAQWPRGLVDTDFREPLISAHPVLLLSGANDPATPARYAEDVIAAGLEGALHLVLPDQGHGMAPVGCVPDLMGAFIDAGTADALDAACLERVIAMPFFLSAAGPGP